MSFSFYILYIATILVNKSCIYIYDITSSFDMPSCVTDAIKSFALSLQIVVSDGRKIVVSLQLSKPFALPSVTFCKKSA